jgi:hypothetical protein
MAKVRFVHLSTISNVDLSRRVTISNAVHPVFNLGSVLKGHPFRDICDGVWCSVSLEEFTGDVS